MLFREAAVLLAVLVCGTAVAADLELQPKSHNVDERVAPAVPAPPVRMQQTQPPAIPPKPDQAAPEPKPEDMLHPPQADAPPGGDSWWQKIVREAPNCRSFSDGCRTCSPGYVCSGLPIACQPKEFTCVDPKPADTKP